MTKNKILLLTFLISGIAFSQNKLKKEINLRKENHIKESREYQQNPKNPKQKKLLDWRLYNREGLLIENKLFLSFYNSHYKFEYLDTTSQILISLDTNGKEIERIILFI